MVGWTEEQRHKASDEERAAHGLLWSIPLMLAVWAILVCFVLLVVFR